MAYCVMIYHEDIMYELRVKGSIHLHGEEISRPKRCMSFVPDKLARILGIKELRENLWRRGTE